MKRTRAKGIVLKKEKIKKEKKKKGSKKKNPKIKQKELSEKINSRAERYKNFPSAKDSSIHNWKARGKSFSLRDFR